MRTWGRSRSSRDHPWTEIFGLCPQRPAEPTRGGSTQRTGDRYHLIWPFRHPHSKVDELRSTPCPRKFDWTKTASLVCDRTFLSRRLVLGLPNSGWLTGGAQTPSANRRRWSVGTRRRVGRPRSRRRSLVPAPRGSSSRRQGNSLLGKDAVVWTTFHPKRWIRKKKHQDWNKKNHQIRKFWDPRGAHLIIPNQSSTKTRKILSWKRKMLSSILIYLERLQFLNHPTSALMSRSGQNVSSARLTMHSTKLCTNFKMFRKKIFLVLSLPLRHF